MVTQKQSFFAKKKQKYRWVSTYNSENGYKKPIVKGFILPFNKEALMKAEEQEKLLSATLLGVSI